MRDRATFVIPDRPGSDVFRLSDRETFIFEPLIDDRGRQIVWAWLTDNPPGEESKGWSGVYGLLRTLWLGEAMRRRAGERKRRSSTAMPRAHSSSSIRHGASPPAARPSREPRSPWPPASS